MSFQTNIELNNFHQWLSWAKLCKRGIITDAKQKLTQMLFLTYGNNLVLITVIKKDLLKLKSKFCKSITNNLKNSYIF